MRRAGILVKAACLESRRSRVRTMPRHYRGEPLLLPGGMLGLRLPRLQFRILGLEGSVISPSSGGSPGPVQPTCSQRLPKTPCISFYFNNMRNTFVDGIYRKMMSGFQYLKSTNIYSIIKSRNRGMCEYMLLCNNSIICSAKLFGLYIKYIHKIFFKWRCRPTLVTSAHFGHIVPVTLPQKSGPRSLRPLWA